MGIIHHSNKPPRWANWLLERALRIRWKKYRVICRSFPYASKGRFIVCLSLFALIAFVTEQRTKEIGIRKVLGASVTNIILMINKDFIKLVMIALTIATPIASTL